MDIKKLVRYYLLGDTIKEIEIDRVLDKVSKKKELTKRERGFLDLYNSIEEDKDLMLLSKNLVFRKVKELLEKKRVIICDLRDRDGKIGLPIKDIENDIESDTCTVYMNKMTHELHDRFLYNIIFNQKNKKYSLQEHDEYFEKIEAKND
jgi:hypothetical protein